MRSNDVTSRSPSGARGGDRRRRAAARIAFPCALALAAAGAARTTDEGPLEPELRWWTLDTGDRIGAGDRVLHGVVASAAVGPMMAGDWSLVGGFVAGFSEPLAPCAADLDGDGAVGGGDLGLLLGAWGACAAPACAADLDGSGTIDGGDLGLLLGAWGACPQ